MTKFQLLLLLIATRTMIVTGFSMKQQPPPPPLRPRSTDQCRTKENDSNLLRCWSKKLLPLKTTSFKVQQSPVLVALLAPPLVGMMLFLTTPAFAADFANQDISGQDFSGQDLSGKDFSGVIAKSTNFHNSNLQGSKFAKAVLVKADFSGANLKGASFVDSTLDGASFKDAVAQGAIFSPSILDIGDLENVDLTDSLWPSKYIGPRCFLFA